jgi:hypothetical protein
MLKLINKIGDNLFLISDKYFQGNKTALTGDSCSNSYDKTSVDHSVIVWDLNQGMDDILLRDLQVSLNFIIPVFIRNRIKQTYKEVCLFFLLDAVIEDENLDDTIEHSKGQVQSPLLAEKIIIISTDIKKKLNSNTLSLLSWVKIKLRRVLECLRHYQSAKPMYLLGDFSPSRYPVIYNSDFRHTFIHYKRN